MKKITLHHSSFNRLLYTTIVFVSLALSLTLGLGFFNQGVSGDVSFYKWAWIVVYAFIVLYIFNERDFLYRLLLSDKYLLVLIILLPLASVSWSVSPSSSFSRAVGLIIPSLFAMTMATSFTIKQMRKGIYILTSLVIITSIFTIILLPQVGVEQTSFHAGLWRGIFHQKNLTGRFFCFMFIFSWFSYRFISKSIFDLFIMLVSVVFILKSGSATALLVGMFAIVFTHLFMSIRNVKQSELAAVFIIIISFLILFVFLMNVQSVFASLGKDTTFSGRTIIWPKLIDMIGTSPFLGFGYGAFWVKGTVTNIATSMYFTWEVNHAHNGYLELVLDLGLVGLTLFFLSVKGYIKNIRLLKGTSPEIKFISYLALAYFIFMILINITQIALVKQNSFYWCFYVFLYALMSQINRTKVNM